MSVRVTVVLVIRGTDDVEAIEGIQFNRGAPSHAIEDAVWDSCADIGVKIDDVETERMYFELKEEDR